ncbi:MAG TPA: hypothetical protein VK549_04265 [Acidimicrobiia bacterium]|nr:hypothetical protein [Acidimicrobiia bacterium]
MPAIGANMLCADRHRDVGRRLAPPRLVGIVAAKDQSIGSRRYRSAIVQGARVQVFNHMADDQHKRHETKIRGRADDPAMSSRPADHFSMDCDWCADHVEVGDDGTVNGWRCVACDRLHRHRRMHWHRRLKRRLRHIL